jgi:hypothetical protein
VSFRVLLTLTAAAGAGYVAARQLLSDDAARRIERLPEGARGPAEAARSRLLRGRERAREAVRAARAERAIAEQELIAEFHRKTGRP